MKHTPTLLITLLLAPLAAVFAAPSADARIVIASEAGAKIASWTNYRSVSSITTGWDSRSNVTNLSLEGTFGRNLSALLSYSYEHDRYFLESNGTNALLSPNDN